MFRQLLTIVTVMGLMTPLASSQEAVQLPAWKESAAKQAIIDFVEKVTTEGSPDYIQPAERIATFDNDGCLWVEQPAYFQLLFILDRVKAMAPDHPEWKDMEPFKSVLEDDIKSVMASGKEGLIKLAVATHTDMTADEFAKSAGDWLATAQHPTLGRRYVDCLYQPQIELLQYLRANGFKTFIVSGGGIDFLRVFAEQAYGIPPEQVVGTSIDATYEVQDGKPVLIKRPSGLFVDDKEGKPVGIYQHIGRPPIIAVGNSDGDFQMLEYATAADHPGLGILIHHDDGNREFAYDRESHIGKLDRGLDEAEQRGWVVVSMKNDWAKVFVDVE